MTRKTLILSIATGLIFMGGLLRFHALSRQSLWDDEASTLQTIQTPWSELLNRHATYETHPPLYFLQLRVWKTLFGGSLTVLRANSALWGTLSLLMLYALAEMDGLGLFALALFVFSPLHLAYSQEMRPYALALFFALCSGWALRKLLGSSPFLHHHGAEVGLTPAVHQPRVSDVILLTVSWTCLLYTHYWGAFVCLAGGVYGLAAATSGRQRWLVGGAGAVAAGLFAFWVPVLHRQIGVINALAFWVDPPSLINVGKTLLTYTGLYFKMASTAFRIPGPQWILATVGAVYAAVFLKGLRIGPWIARSWLLLGLLVPCALSFYSHGIYLWYRYPVIMFPAFVLLIASGLRDVKGPALRGILAGVLLGAELVGVWHYFSGWQKANPKAVVAFIDSYARPRMVVIRPRYFSTLYAYYDHGRTAPLATDTFDSAQKREALRGQLIFYVGFDIPGDVIRDAFLQTYHLLLQRHFPGYAHLGITVYVFK